MSQHRHPILMPHSGEERRVSRGLSNAEFNALAERAADILEERMYRAIGKWTVNRFLLLCGTITGAVALILTYGKKFGLF